MSGYSIETKNHTVRVVGTLKDNGRVEVEYDDDSYVFNSQRGIFGRNLHMTRNLDGSYVQEGPTVQKIFLPNGVAIKKGRNKMKLRTPDGEVTEKTVGQSSSADRDSDSITEDEIKKISGSNHSINIDFRSPDSNSQEEVDSEYTVEKQDLIDSLVPGFWTILFTITGLLGQAQFFLFLGITIYLVYALPAVFRFVLERSLISNDEEETAEDSAEIEDIKQRYQEGDIDQHELENRIAEEMEEENKSRELSMETN